MIYFVVAHMIFCPFCGAGETSVKIDLQLPVDMPDDIYTLELSGYDGNTKTFENTTSLQFMNKGFSIFIQTDKAMYKPGQNGNLLKRHCFL